MIYKIQFKSQSYTQKHFNVNKFAIATVSLYCYYEMVKSYDIDKANKHVHFYL